MKGFVVLFFVLLMFGCAHKKEIKHLDSFERKYKFDSEIFEKLEKDTVAWKHQLSANEFMLKGKYKKALKEWDKAFKGRNISYSEAKKDSLKKIFTIHNAKDEIIKRSEDSQIIIINEAHHNSNHRLFTKLLLKELFDKGYKHLGLEALDNGVDKDLLLNERGYPIKKSGYYTNDPKFSLLIREAKRIGYNIFSYEQNIGVNNAKREIEQAKNIKKEIDKYPVDKFLIHCGFDHVLEGDYKRWGKTMTGRLKEYTGIDPLTINQTKYSEKGSKEFNTPMLKVFEVKSPSVLKDKSGNLFKYKRSNAWADIAIFHPLISEKNKEVKKSHVLELDKLELNNYPLMVLVFERNDNINQAVPIVIKEAYDEQEKIILNLEKGIYKVVVVNKENDAVTFQEEIK